MPRSVAERTHFKLIYRVIGKLLHRANIKFRVLG